MSSQHLRVLREAGLISQRKVGRERRYKIEPARLKDVFDWVGHYAGFWREKLMALGDTLDQMDDDKEKEEEV